MKIYQQKSEDFNFSHILSFRKLINENKRVLENSIKLNFDLNTYQNKSAKKTHKVINKKRKDVMYKSKQKDFQKPEKEELKKKQNDFKKSVIIDKIRSARTALENQQLSTLGNPQHSAVGNQQYFAVGNPQKSRVENLQQAAVAANQSAIRSPQNDKPPKLASEQRKGLSVSDLQMRQSYVEKVQGVH